jgi:hypothetical protein
MKRDIQRSSMSIQGAFTEHSRTEFFGGSRGTAWCGLRKMEGDAHCPACEFDHSVKNPSVQYGRISCGFQVTQQIIFP